MRGARALLLTVAALLAVEAGLRVSRFGLTTAALGRWQERPAWRAVRTLDARGPRPIPGGRARWALQAGSPVIEYRMDGDGFRVGSATPPGEPARCHVLVAGDGNPFGYGVPADAAFPARLESLLRARGAAVAVSNAGIPGSGVPQQRRWVEESLARRPADVVVFALSPWSLRMEQPPNPWDDATFGGRLWTVVGRWSARVGGWSAVVERGRRRAFHSLAARIGWPRDSIVAWELEPLYEPRPRFVRRIAAAAAEIKALAERLRADGTALVLVLVPIDVQVSRARNRLYRGERLPYPSYGFRDRDYTRDGRYAAALAELAAALRVRAIDATHRLATHPEDSYLRDDYHLSEGGHRRIAEEIAPAVREACDRTVEASWSAGRSLS